MENDQKERKEWLRAIGQAVRAHRKELGVSQEELGFRCGLDRTYVSAVERGVRNPTVWVLRRLAFGLGRSPSEVLITAEALPERKGKSGA